MKYWPPWERTVVKVENVINESFVTQDRIILPALYIKLGLVKLFQKLWIRAVQCFEYLVHKLSRFKMEKLKGWIFCGPQIRKLKNVPYFIPLMSEIESSFSISFVLVVKNFISNKKAAIFLPNIFPIDKLLFIRELFLPQFHQLIALYILILNCKICM